jgi:puromycin-sensitive aminopeptidase
LNHKQETILQLSQQRFFSNGEKPSNEENFWWKVPISIVTSSSYPKVHQEILLTERSGEVNLGILVRDEIIKLNKHCLGMYRTNYTPEMLGQLIELVKIQKIHPTDRLGLQSDAFAMSKAGLLSAAEVLKFCKGYLSEDNVTVWNGLMGNLDGLSHILLNSDVHHELQSFVCWLLKPISKKLGYDPIEGESSLSAMCRATVLRNLAFNGDKDMIAEGKKKFEAHLNGCHTIPADLRSAVYAAVLYDADEEMVDKFIDLHDKSQLQEEKMRLACSLASVRSPELIQRVLEFSLSPKVRNQDSVSVICAVSANTSTKHSSDMAWEFVKKNWDTIYSRYSSGFLITSLIKVKNFKFSKLNWLNVSFKELINYILKTVIENFACDKVHDDIEVRWKAIFLKIKEIFLFFLM